MTLTTIITFLVIDNFFASLIQKIKNEKEINEIKAYGLSMRPRTPFFLGNAMCTVKMNYGKYIFISSIVTKI